jgi:hypothetical protein
MEKQSKIAKLISVGANDNLALLLYWNYLTEEEKSVLNTKQCQWIWENTSSNYLEKNKIWSLLKEKAEGLLKNH